jgi:hydroxymethylbilane synthase
VLDPARFVPAPGQGTLALQAREDDARTRDALAAIGCADTLACLTAERALARALDASCDTPLGAHAMRESDGALRLRAWVGLPDGSAWIGDELTGDAEQPQRLGVDVAKRLALAGATEILRSAGEHAAERAAAATPSGGESS